MSIILSTIIPEGGLLSITDGDFTISGDIGIGVQVPEAKLDVSGTARISGNTSITSTTASTSTTSGALTVAGGVGIAGAAYIGGLTRITDTTASTSTTTGALTVNGGVGIGGALNVNGTATFQQGNPSDGFTNNQILFGFGGTATYRHAIKTRHRSSANDTENAIDFYVWQTSDSLSAVGSKQAMSITSAGVGIGTPIPRMRSTVLDTNAKMAIVSTAENQASALYFGTPQSVGLVGNAYKTAIIAQGLNSWSRNHLHFCLNNNTSSNNASEDATVTHSRMMIQSGGNVGIGTTSPARLLDVAGTFRCHNATFSYIESDLLPFGYGTGEVGFNSRPWSKMHAGEFNIASDARQKKDIAVYSEGLAFITQLVPKTYKYKHVITDKTKIGFLAQEVLQVNPTFAGVNYDETEDIYTMSMDQFTGPLVNCIKELNTELLATKSELLAMRTFIESKFPKT